MGAKRSRCRPKRTWFGAIKKDIVMVNLTEEMTHNRTTHVDDPKNSG